MLGPEGEPLVPGEDGLSPQARQQIFSSPLVSRAIENSAEYASPAAALDGELRAAVEDTNGFLSPSLFEGRMMLNPAVAESQLTALASKGQLTPKLAAGILERMEAAGAHPTALAQATAIVDKLLAASPEWSLIGGP